MAKTKSSKAESQPTAEDSSTEQVGLRDKEHKKSKKEKRRTKDGGDHQSSDGTETKRRHKKDKEKRHRKTKKSSSHKRRSPSVQLPDEDAAKLRADGVVPTVVNVENASQKDDKKPKGNSSPSSTARLTSVIDDSTTASKKTSSGAPREAAPAAAPPSGAAPESLHSGQRVDELSIEESNKIRAKLGLKPLQVAGAKSSTVPGEGATATKQQEVHAPPVNISEVKKTEKVKEKLQLIKDKRLLESKARSLKTLGEASDDEESMEQWVAKNKRQTEERRKVAERIRLQDEIDAASEATQRYSANDLQGLKVEHDLDNFQQGRDVILTLKDSGVLDTESGDVLVSTMLDEESRLKKNIENRKKKAIYNPYDTADDFEQLGGIPQPKILKKYDETIGGEQKKAFVLEAGGTSSVQSAMEQSRQQVQLLGLQSLIGLPQMVAKDYYNEEEMAAKFKKGKKRNKDSKTHSRVKKEEDDVPVRIGLSRIIDYGDEMTLASASRSRKIDDEEDDVELQMALQRTRRMKLHENVPQATNAERIAQRLFVGPEVSDVGRSDVFLDETSEFCRAVGSSSTGKAVKEEVESFGGEQEAVDMDIDDDNMDMSEERKGGWSEVQFEAEPANLGSDEEEEPRRKPRAPTTDQHGRRVFAKSILDEEPTCERGVGAALQLAVKKGLLDQQQETRRQLQVVGRGAASSVPAQTYVIDDKIIDDDKRSRHDRYQGPTVPFKEKPGYKPGFKLEYHDSTGRSMNSKEAFRDLSHKFHGKGPGKLKTERRVKKYQEEKLLMEMSSVDTPLHTVEKMMLKQQELQTPYILLSGPTAKGPTPISKRSNF